MPWALAIYQDLTHHGYDVFFDYKGIGFQKVPRKAARHHLSWLIQHRLCGLTCEEIADRHAERNPQLESPPTGDAVSKTIRRTAEALELV